LVMNTFDAAVALEPDARPLFHSDRGFQYTSRQFCTRLKKHHMKQSMSRVAHCIDNGPMEGFWGILKREKYYGRRFTPGRIWFLLLRTTSATIISNESNGICI
jgi:transposase InsO family protein